MKHVAAKLSSTNINFLKIWTLLCWTDCKPNRSLLHGG